MIKKQKETLQYIHIFITTFDSSPTIQNIADNFDITVQSAHSRVVTLIANGLVVKDEGRNRSIRLTGQALDLMR
jgi:predicted transcriptional regulator